MLEQNPESFSARERIAISEYLGKIDSRKNAFIFGKALVEIRRKFNKWNLQEIEEILRDKGSTTFLIAAPISEQPKFNAVIPGNKEKRLPYYLWTVVNGLDEATKKMVDLEISYDENFSRLANTGFLAAKEGSDISRQLQAPLN